MKLRQHLFRRNGYTIVEMIVVVMIMVMLSGMLISFSRVGQKQTALYIEASKIISFIMQSRSLAITAYKDPGLGNRITCGHGVFFDMTGDANTFKLIRYLKKPISADPLLPPPELCGNIGVTSPTPLVDRYERSVVMSDTLSEGIGFDSLTDVADVIFRPPDPEIFFYGQNGQILGGSIGKIVIKDSLSGDKIEIKVGHGGQISYRFL